MRLPATTKSETYTTLLIWRLNCVLSYLTAPAVQLFLFSKSIVLLTFFVRIWFHNLVWIEKRRQIISAIDSWLGEIMNKVLTQNIKQVSPWLTDVSANYPSSISHSSFSQLSQCYRNKTLSPRDVIDRCTEVANKYKELNYFITFCPDLAAQQADESSQRWSEDKSLGPLDGIPVAVKDTFCVKDIRTTCASKYVVVTPPTMRIWMKVYFSRISGCSRISSQLTMQLHVPVWRKMVQLSWGRPTWTNSEWALARSIHFLDQHETFGGNRRTMKIDGISLVAVQVDRL